MCVSSKIIFKNFIQWQLNPTHSHFFLIQLEFVFDFDRTGTALYVKLKMSGRNSVLQERCLAETMSGRNDGLHAIADKVNSHLTASQAFPSFLSFLTTPIKWL